MGETFVVALESPILNGFEDFTLVICVNPEDTVVNAKGKSINQVRRISRELKKQNQNC